MVKDYPYIDMTFLDSGDTKDGKNLSFGPMIKTVYSLHFAVSGKGYLECNGAKFEISAGQSFLCLPNTTVRYYPDENDPWELIWINFTGHGTKNYLRYTAFSVSNPVSPVLDKKLSQLFEIFRNSFPITPFYITYTAGQLRLIFAEYIKQFPFDDQKKQPTERRKAKRVKKEVSDIKLVPFNKDIKTTADEEFELAMNLIVHCVYDPNVSIDTIAKQLNFSRSTLYRRFKEKAGMSPNQYINICRMKQAEHFLSHTNLSMKDIALTIGYPDQLYFSRVFRAHHGMSPTEYKNSKGQKS